MQATVAVAVLTIGAAACSSPSESATPPGDAQAMPSSSGDSPIGGPAVDAASGGQADAAGASGSDDGSSAMSPEATPANDANPEPPGDANADIAAPPTGGEGGAGNTVLMIGGAMPMIGLDRQYRQVLTSRNLVIQDIRETVVKPSDTVGKRLVLLSYSVDSAAFSALPLASVPVPMFVTEHMVLGELGMTTAAGHGFQTGLTAVSIISNDPLLTAGFPMGNLTVYGQTGEFFWGNPGPGSINVATVPGNASRVAYFAYPAGSMMAGMVAPAKRLLFPAVAHAPPPEAVEYLNADGLKLLGGAIDWLLK
jgi:hypothetical protein